MVKPATFKGYTDEYTVDCERVRVTFEAGGIAWMQPPPVELGDTLGLRTAAALLGLAEVEVESSYPCRFATIGPWFVLVGVKTLDALQRVKIHPEVYEDIAAGGVALRVCLRKRDLQRRCRLRCPHVP